MASREFNRDQCSQYRRRLDRLRSAKVEDDRRFDSINAPIRKLQIQIAHKESELRRTDLALRIPALPGPFRGRGPNNRRRGPSPEASIGAAAGEAQHRQAAHTIRNEIQSLQGSLRETQAERIPIIRRRNETIAAFATVVQQARIHGCTGV